MYKSFCVLVLRFRIVSYLFLLILSLNLILKAEVIDNKRITTKKFDVWTVSCEDDEMFKKIKCRMFVEITSGTTLFINPNSTNNKLLFVSKDIYSDTKAYIKVDDNNLLDSETFTQNKYSFLKFNPISLNLFYNQMRLGNTFFMRFTIKDKFSQGGYKEITIKISLDKFQDAFSYLIRQGNKYDNNKK